MREGVGARGMERRYTAQLAAYAAGWTEASLTPAIVERAREIVLDTLGAILLGAGPEYGSVRRLAELARETGGAPRCTAIAQGFKTDVLSALLINGTAGYAADVEGAGVGRQHAAAVLVPTALTVGEYVGASGRRVVAALALAYDLAARIDDAAATAHAYPHSFHPSAVFGHFGAAVAAGCLLGLDADGVERALGLAGLNAGGLIVWINDPAEEARPFVIGVAAQAGARAALLASRGYGGPLGIADPGTYDIYDAFSGEAHPERLTAGLGEDFRILTAGGYKRYPCCGDIHTGLDALLAILARHDLPPERIARITHAVHPERRAVIDDNPLQSHCAQYIMAVAAVERRITPDVILVDRRATDPRVAAMVGRVRLIADEAFRAGPAGQAAWVELVATDGATYREEVSRFRGTLQRPLTPAEIRAKFMDFAGGRLGAARAAGVAGLVDRLETLPDIGELMAALA
jgi:2-methylcitrate dehydratase PrpD